MTVLVDYLRNSFDANSIGRAASNILGQAFDSATATVALPTKLNDTLDMLQKGHVKVGMRLSATEEFSRDLRAVTGLIAIAFIAMGLIIGSCILDASDTTLSPGGFPLIGCLGLAAGLVLAIYVFMKIRPYLK